MTRVAEIQEAIMALSDADFTRLRQWLTELDWQKWERQIEEDSAAGKLDFLIAEANDAKTEGTLRDL